MVQRGNVKVVVCGSPGRHSLELSVLSNEGEWRIVCATGLVDTVSIWSTATMEKSDTTPTARSIPTELD